MLAPMRQLSGLDSAFLNLENATQFGHVSGLSIFTRPDIPGYEPYAAWKEQLEQRPAPPRALRRLAEVPLADVAALARSAGFAAGGADAVTARRRQHV